MTTWKRVKWSEADQVLDLLKVPKAGRRLEAASAPEIYFEALRRDGELMDAAKFLGQALPRLEGVAWAARAVRDVMPQAPASEPESRALRATLLFVQDPSDQRRRTAYDAATACEDKGPEALVAMAAFFSGGSIGPPNGPPVPAPRLASGRLASGAVIIAAYKDKPRLEAEAALARCLDAGAELAREGLKT